MSECFANYLIISIPSFDLRFTHMLFLFLFAQRKYAESACSSSDYYASFGFLVNGGPHFLVSSPSKDSTLITSAPKSLNYIVPNGPAKILDKSKTLIPSNRQRYSS